MVKRSRVPRRRRMAVGASMTEIVLHVVWVGHTGEIGLVA